MSNILYVSDNGSDQNDCPMQSTPCQNLQTVLDRAMDGADIYVTSDTLSLYPCKVNSSLSYNIMRINGEKFSMMCSAPGLY